jgi:4-hydroxy-3-methylbut-2-enyl diphosphate reductase
VMVVVGGRNSNNTHQLIQTSRAAGIPTHHVERADDLQPVWFHNVRHAGITAGTSTLKETVEEVRCRMQSIADAQTLPEQPEPTTLTAHDL